MHEYPVTEQIVKIAEAKMRENNLEKITKINLVVGEYSGYVAESIKMYFDIITENTSIFGAELDIEFIKPKLKCEGCKKLFERKPFSFECPFCGGQGVPTEIGREFYIKSIEGE